MLIIDAHLDLSMNALEWNRDLTLPAAEIRRREEGMTDKKDRGKGTVSLPEMRRGQVGICVATMIARSAPGKSLLRQLPGFSSPEIAWAMTQGQLAWYRAMEERGEMTPIVDRRSLLRHVTLWGGAASTDEELPVPEECANDDIGGTGVPGGEMDRAPIGYILSLEGADSIFTPKHLERSYAQGLRAVGPVHYGNGRYGHGTHATGGLTAIGRELLAEMRRLNVILDATHLCDESFWEALDCYDGPVWASHNNCRALVPDGRQFSDEQLKALIDRGAVICGALDAWMLVPGWERGVTTPQSSGVGLRHLIDHLDHVCQLAGNANHCAIGTDLDGAFGKEQSPGDLDTIADLQKLPDLLASRGYSSADVRRICHDNLIRFLCDVWQ